VSFGATFKEFRSFIDGDMAKAMPQSGDVFLLTNFIPSAGQLH